MIDVVRVRSFVCYHLIPSAIVCLLHVMTDDDGGFQTSLGVFQV